MGVGEALRPMEQTVVSECAFVALSRARNIIKQQVAPAAGGGGDGLLCKLYVTRYRRRTLKHTSGPRLFPENCMCLSVIHSWNSQSISLKVALSIECIKSMYEAQSFLSRDSLATLSMHHRASAQAQPLTQLTPRNLFIGSSTQQRHRIFAANRDADGGRSGLML